MKNTIKILGVGLIACVLVACSVSAQVYQSIPLPFTTLVGGTSTNIANGWTNSTITTNIVNTWNTSTGLMVTTTNLTTNTTVASASFYSGGRSYVGLQRERNSSYTGSTSNEVLTVARSVTGARFDTLNNLLVTNRANGTNVSVGVYQVDMRGFGVGRIINVQEEDLTNTVYYTNFGLYYDTPVNSKY